MTTNEDILKQMKHSMADDLIRKPFDIDVLAHLATKCATTQWDPTILNIFLSGKKLAFKNQNRC